MKRYIHAVSGAVALLTIVTFWSATALVELFGDQAQIAAVKLAIAYCLLVLIPAMGIAGASGFSLGGKWKSPIVKRKLARMKVIAATGILVLAPSAIFLAVKAGSGAFDGVFAAVQAVELVAGASNILLLGLNMRDGMAMHRRRPAAA